MSTRVTVWFERNTGTAHWARIEQPQVNFDKFRVFWSQQFSSEIPSQRKEEWQITQFTKSWECISKHQKPGPKVTRTFCGQKYLTLYFPNHSWEMGNTPTEGLRCSNPTSTSRIDHFDIDTATSCDDWESDKCRELVKACFDKCRKFAKHNKIDGCCEFFVNRVCSFLIGGEKRAIFYENGHFATLVRATAREKTCLCWMVCLKLHEVQIIITSHINLSCDQRT